MPLDRARSAASSAASRASSAASSAASRASDAASSAASTVRDNVSSPGSRGETASSVSSGTAGSDSSEDDDDNGSNGSGGSGRSSSSGSSSRSSSSSSGGSEQDTRENITESVSDIGSNISDSISERLSFGSSSDDTGVDSDRSETQTKSETPDVDIPDSTESELRSSAAESTPGVDSDDIAITGVEIGDTPETASEVEDISSTQRREARQQAAEQTDLFDADDLAITGVEETDDGRRFEVSQPEVEAEFEVEGSDSESLEMTQTAQQTGRSTATGIGTDEIDLSGQAVEDVETDDSDFEILGPGDDLPSSVSGITDIDFGGDELVSTDISVTDAGQRRAISETAQETIGLDFDPVEAGRSARDDAFDALDPRDIDVSDGGAGTALAAGAAVAVPEPSTTAGGAATIGAIGLGVGGAAVASQTEIDTPSTRDEFDQPEIDIDRQQLTQTTTEIDIDGADRTANGVTGGSEIPAPTTQDEVTPVSISSEISTPEAGQTSEIGLPEIEAAATGVDTGTDIGDGFGPTGPAIGIGDETGPTITDDQQRIGIEREFPTGESAVVGRDTATQEETQQPTVSDSGFESELFEDIGFEFGVEQGSANIGSFAPGDILGSDTATGDVSEAATFEQALTQTGFQAGPDTSTLTPEVAVSEPVLDETSFAEPTETLTETTPPTQTRSIGGRRPPIPGLDSGDDDDREEQTVGFVEDTIEFAVDDLDDISQDLLGGGGR